MNSSDEKKFSVLSDESVRIYAESIGLPHLSENVVQGLAEDVTYRVRELISKSCCFMRAARRKTLKGSDVNRALFWDNIPPLRGASSDMHFTGVDDVHCTSVEVVDLKDEVTKLEFLSRETRSATLKRSWYNSTSMSISGLLILDYSRLINIFCTNYIDIPHFCFCTQVYFSVMPFFLILF